MSDQSQNQISDHTQGIIFKIKKFAIHDGPGIRTSIFFKGCPLCCIWCHNPEGISFKPEQIRCTTENGVLNEIVGKRVSVEALITEIEKDIIFYDESGGGVTFTGGEPVSQPDFLMALLNECKKRDIHTAVDTSGFAEETCFLKIARNTNLVLFDLKILEDTLHTQFTGQSNSCIVNNLKQLSKIDIKTQIRFPLIPGINDHYEHITRLALFLKSLENLRQIDILPFHCSAEGKYKGLGIENKMKNVETPSKEQIQSVKKVFERNGFTVNIGG